MLMRSPDRVFAYSGIGSTCYWLTPKKVCVLEPIGFAGVRVAIHGFADRILVTRAAMRLGLRIKSTRVQGLPEPCPCKEIYKENIARIT